MPDWFTADQRWALIRRYGLEGPETPEQMAIAEACELSPEVRELWATRDKWLDRDEFARLLWPRVLRALGILEDGAPLGPEIEPKGDPGRRPGTMPAKTFWKIFELGMAHADSDDETPSLRSIAETTKRHPELEYVPRDRVTPIVDWIAANRRRARGYWERREIPPQFRATVTG